MDYAIAYGKRIKLARLQNLLVADVFPKVGTPIDVLCSTRRNFFRLPRAMTVPPAPVSTSNKALTRLISTSMTKRFGSVSRFFCLSFTTPKPSCFKKLFSVVDVFAAFFSESLGTVINGDAGNGVGVTSGPCVTGLASGESTADGANAGAAAIWIPHVATAIQVDMYSSFMVDPPRLTANCGMFAAEKNTLILSFDAGYRNGFEGLALSEAS